MMIYLTFKVQSEAGPVGRFDIQFTRVSNIACLFHLLKQPALNHAEHSFSA